MNWRFNLKKVNVESILQIALVIFLLCFVFVIPPFQKPDETTHYRYALNLTQLNFNCQKNTTIPLSFTNLPMHAQVDIKFHFERKYNFNKLIRNLQKENNSFAIVNSCSSILHFGYFPQAIGLSIGLLLAPQTTMAPLIGFYFGRLLMAFLFYFVFLYVIKGVNSRYKLFLYSFAFLPMLLNQVSAYNYDGLLICTFIITILSLMKLLAQEKKYLLPFIISLIVIQYIRPGFYLLPFIFFIVPTKTICKNNFKYFLISILYLMVAFIPFIIALQQSDVNDTISSYSIDGYSVDPSAQLNFVLTNPLHFLKAFLITNYYSNENYLISMIGVLGWLDYKLPFFIYLIYLAGLFLGLWHIVKNTKKRILNNWQLIFGLFILIGSYVLIHLIMYFNWSELGSLVISGVQGRYFLIFLPLLALLIPDIWYFLRKIDYRLVVIATLALILFTINYETKARYYNYQNLWFNEQSIIDQKEILIKEQDTDLIGLPIEKISRHSDTQSRTTGFVFYSPDFIATAHPNLLYEVRDKDCERILTKGFIPSDVKVDKDLVFVSHQLLSSDNGYCYSLLDLDTGDNKEKLRVGSFDKEIFLETLLLP